MIEACKANAVSVALVRGAGDIDMSSAIGRGIAEIMATLGRLENEQKSVRQRRAFEQHRATGKPWGPIPAFGYKPDRVTVVEHEAEMLREAYTAVLRGESCRSIAAKWNAAGAVSRTGKPWSGAAVKRVLVNPRYAGIRGTTVGAGNRRDLLEVGPAAWTAIVSEDVWRGARAVLTDPQRRSTDVRHRVHLLAGLARCGRCGAPMRSRVTSRGKAAYTCSVQRHLSRDAAGLERLVREVVLARLALPDGRELLAGEHDAAALATATAEAARLRGLLDRRADDYADGTLDKRQYIRARDRVRLELVEAERVLADYGRRAVVPVPAPGADLGEWWDGLTLAGRRALVEALVTITVRPSKRGPVFDEDSVEIGWRTAEG